MTTSLRGIALAGAAGVILAVMIALNSRLAAASSPLFASWLAHGSGALVAGLLLRILMRSRQQTAAPRPVPYWAWLGGVPGALTVLLAAITVNSPLALSGSLALMLLGQILFSVAADGRGWFGVARRRLSRRDIGALALILVGSLMLIYGR